ncbi:restriction endonuclease subunit S [Erwinia sp. AnSW2-5]|uniref:restriction endonuclease subunit S n=1 Tax=Erwinia sp. AnSW2-5 TaxID=3367692 RepID=UPI00385F6287
MSVDKLITDHIDIWSSALQTRSTAGRGSRGKIDLYGIKKLRELILELAVRGKLVPQDPNDEPASELLKRIAAEKAELVKQGKIKKQKPLPEISEDEKPFELPGGWEWTSLSEIAAINPKIEVTDDDQEISFVPMPCVSTRFDGFHEQETKKWGEVKKGYTHFADGDVALAKITPCFENSKAAVFRGLKGGVGVGTTELHVARPFSTELNLQYILLNMKSPHYLSIGESKMTGSAGQKRVPRSFFENYPIPFPSSVEQTRIVETFSKLMSLCDQLEQQSLTSLEAHQQLVETLLATLTDSQNAKELTENWARISQHFDTLFTTEASIDALKKTILQLAVMGKLVPQDPNDEPASELLKRIEQEKVKLVKEGKIKKQKPLPLVSDEEKPYELPVGWEWCRFGSVINVRAELVKPENYYDFFQVAPDIIEKGTGKVISQRTVKESGIKGPNSRFYKNQIVYSKIRPSLSKVFIAGYDGLCSADMYPLDCFLNTGYLLKVMLSEVFLIQVRAAENRIKMPKLNVESLSNILIPVPPAGIQSAVFSEISQMDTFCDQLKSRLQSAQQTQLHLADALTDAALN